jgi:hypothetical protein
VNLNFLWSILSKDENKGRWYECVGRGRFLVSLKSGRGSLWHNLASLIYAQFVPWRGIVCVGIPLIRHLSKPVVTNFFNKGASENIENTVFQVPNKKKDFFFKTCFDCILPICGLSKNL